MLNRIVLVGRMVADPELRKTANGTSVLGFRLASDDSRKNPNGDRNTLFIGCSFFGQRADTIARYTHKGSLVAVEGRLQQRKYTNRNGQEVTVYEIICDNVEFLDPKGSAPSDSGFTPDVAPASAPASSSSASDSIDIADDDLPW